MPQPNKKRSSSQEKNLLLYLKNMLGLLLVGGAWKAIPARPAQQYEGVVRLSDSARLYMQRMIHNHCRPHSPLSISGQVLGGRAYLTPSELLAKRENQLNNPPFSTNFRKLCVRRLRDSSFELSSVDPSATHLFSLISHMESSKFGASQQTYPKKITNKSSIILRKF